MRRALWAGGALGVALSYCALAASQSAQPVTQAVRAAPGAAGQVTFQLERAGALVPRFALAIEEDGEASYVAEQASPMGARDSGTTPATQHVEQRVVLTQKTTERIFALARSLGRFNITCESLEKNIADLGRKTLSYSGPEGNGSCSYNFSENKNVMALTELLQGITATLDLGRKLDFDHRFDRLGLDQDTADLMQAVAEGRAIEVNAIARTLRSIAEDSEVLERVRSRATTLLQRFPPTG